MIKRKRYYYENLMVTGVDKTTMYQLEALYTKYTRDYLPYFRSLAQMYKKGDQKKFSEESVVAVEKVRSLIDSILKTGSINEQDTQKLVDLIDEIEDRKDSFVRKAQTNKSLADKMDEVSKRTGITPEDMNVTREIGSRAAAQAKQVTREGREGVLPFLRRTAPRTSRIISEATTSALGPFAPMASLAKDVAGEVFNVGRGAKEKIQGWRDFRLQSNLRPVSGLGSPDPFNLLNPRTTGGAHMPLVRGDPSRRDEQFQFASLMMFFDKGAYKAKWTKELLDVTKKSAERARGLDGGVSITSVLDGLKEFGAALVPFLGKAGLLAVLALTVGATATAVKSASDKYELAKKEEFGAAERLAKAYQDQMEVIKKVGLDAYSKAAGKSPKQVLVEKEGERQRIQQERYRSLPWHSREKLHGRFIGAYTGRNPYAPENQNLVPYERRLQIQEEQLKKLQTGQSGGSSKMPEINVTVPGLDGVGRQIQELMEQMKQNVQVQQPGPRLVNVHDSGDVLTREHAKGNLTLGD